MRDAGMFSDRDAEELGRIEEMNPQWKDLAEG